MKVLGQFKEDDLLESSDKEKTYFCSSKVTVTNARIIVQSQTYVMAALASVKFEEEKPKRLWPILLILVGLIGMAANAKFPRIDTQQANSLAVVFGILPGVIWLMMQRTKFCIRLGVSSGESKALQSKDKKLVTNAYNAINAAIIERQPAPSAHATPGGAG